MADTDKDDEPVTDLGGMISFVPDLALDGLWSGLPFEVDIVFEPDE